MGTVVIIGVLLVFVAFALKGTIKHYKGQGGCCGGGGTVKKARRQKLEETVSVRKISIDGMTCDNCRKRVENCLNSLGKVNARVNLKQGTAVVKLGELLPDEELRTAVEGLGYKVTAIVENI